MRIYRLISTAIGGVLFAGMGATAHAGCFGGNATDCNPQTISYPAPVDRLAPIHVYGQNPYGHLKTFSYKNTPNVNIMRLRSRAPFVNLGDRPAGYTNGCNPSVSAYCRAPQSNVTYAPAPQSLSFAAPAPKAEPFISAPAPVQNIVTNASGYNPSAFAPRQYGSLDFVPGIAHVPTSIIDRSPITHLDGVPQPQVSSVTTAPRSHSTYSTTSSFGSGYTVPAPQQPATNVIGSVVTNQYSYQPAGGGAYWEKTSGPTVVDGLPATQIVCRRQAPRPAPVNVRVVSPVIGVPHPVPTPVGVNTCGPVSSNGFAAPVLAGGPSTSRYGSRWTY